MSVALCYPNHTSLLVRNPSLLSTAGNEQLGRDRGLQTIYVHTADYYYYYYYY